MPDTRYPANTVGGVKEGITESQKLDLEIENFLLAKKKLKLEIMEIVERRGISS